HACAAATPPARPPTASYPPPVLPRTLPQLSRRSSSHCCAHDSHPHARCPQSALHRATRPAPSPLCKSPPARPPNSFPAGIAARSAAVQTRCAPASKDRKSTRLNSIHVSISYAVFCLKKKKTSTLLPLTTNALITRCLRSSSMYSFSTALWCRRTPTDSISSTQRQASA